MRGHGVVGTKGENDDDDDVDDDYDEFYGDEAGHKRSTESVSCQRDMVVWLNIASDGHVSQTGNRAGCKLRKW